MAQFKTPSSNVFLIGPMGAGKSTIGKLLAQELQFPFKDSDRVIVERAGADVPWIFDVEGEAGFRARESAVIDELTQLESIVLATGGGAILSEFNRECLKSRGHVVYLETSLEQQIERTSKDRQRPLLQQPNPEKILADLMEVRAPIYNSIADLVVSTNGNSPKHVMSEIVAWMKEQPAADITP